MPSQNFQGDIGVDQFYQLVFRPLFLYRAMLTWSASTRIWTWALFCRNRSISCLTLLKIEDSITSFSTASLSFDMLNLCFAGMETSICAEEPFQFNQFQNIIARSERSCGWSWRRVVSKAIGHTSWTLLQSLLSTWDVLHCCFSLQDGQISFL